MKYQKVLGVFWEEIMTLLKIIHYWKTIQFSYYKLDFVSRGLSFIDRVLVVCQGCGIFYRSGLLNPISHHWDP